MELYYVIPSTYSQKALLAFYEKGVAFKPMSVAMMDPKAKEEYKKIYPLGKVPLLKGEGIFIPESTIIIEYLEDTYLGQGTRLIPADKTEARRVRFKDRMCDLYLNEPISTIFFDTRKPAGQQNPEAVAKARATMNVMYDFLEKDLSENQYMQGNSFSMADCAAFAPLFYAQKLQPFSDRPHIVKYFERLQARPSAQKVLAELMPVLAAMNG